MYFRFAFKIFLYIILKVTQNNLTEFLKLSSLKNIFLAVFLFFLTACSLFDPFVDRRRNAGADLEHLYVGRSTKENPAICYNGLWTSEEQLQSLADAECQKHGTGTHALKTGKSTLTCKLFLPTHAYYQCVKE